MGLKATVNGQDWKGYLINRNSHEFKNKRLTLRSHKAKTLENRLFFDSLKLGLKMDGPWGWGWGKNALIKIATKQYLGHLMILEGGVAERFI